MTPAELTVFEAAAAGRRHVVEFGSGGSTLVMLKGGVERIDSVESDRAWVDRLSSQADCAAAIDEGRLRLHFADVGPTRKFGYPLKTSDRTVWPAYWSAVWTGVDAAAVDMVFVDGRFRVACTLNSLLNVGRQTVFCIHDFWSRTHYHAVLEFLTVVCRVDTLGVFMASADLDRTRVAQVLADYAVNPR